MAIHVWENLGSTKHGSEVFNKFPYSKARKGESERCEYSEMQYVWDIFYLLTIQNLLPFSSLVEFPLLMVLIVPILFADSLRQ